MKMAGSFRFKLTVFVVSILLVAMLLITFSGYHLMKSVVWERTEADCRSYAENVNKVLTDTIEGLHTKARSIGEELAVAVGHAADAEQTIRGELDLYAAASDMISGILVSVEEKRYSVGTAPISASEYDFYQTPLPNYGGGGYISLVDGAEEKLIRITVPGNAVVESVTVIAELGQTVVQNELGGLYAVTAQETFNMAGIVDEDIHDIIPRGFTHKNGSMWAEDYYISYVKNEYAGWYTVFVMEKSVLMNVQNTAVIWFGFLYAVLAILTAAAAFFMIKKVCAPLTSISRQIREIGDLANAKKIRLPKRKFAHRQSFQRKVMISLSVLVTVSLMFSTGGTYLCMRQMVLSYTGRVQEMLLEQTANNLSRWFRKIEDLSWTMTISNELRALLNAPENQEASGGLAGAVLKHTSTIDGFADMRLYDAGGALLFSAVGSDKNRMLESEEMRADGDSTGWYSEENAVGNNFDLVYQRKIFGYGMTDVDVPVRPIAYLEVAVSESSLHAIYAAGNPNGQFVLLDKNKRVQSDFGGKYQRRIMTEEEIKKAAQSKRYFCKSAILNFPNNWQIYWMLPSALLFNGLQNLLPVSMGIAVCTLLAALLLTLLFSRHLIIRLQTFYAAAEQVDGGNLDTQWTLSGRDEIAVLADSFNQMLERIKQMMQRREAELEERRRLEQQNERMEKHKKELELDMFQSQINTHFLYNTISSVNFMIMQNRGEEAVQMLESIGTLFRSMADKSSVTVTVEEELAHAKAYVFIQKKRFENRFEMIWQVDENVRSLQIPRMVLQPCIENAIYHAAEDGDGTCTIEVAIERRDGELAVRIMDDGRGIDPEQLERIWSALKTGQKSKSIGLVNINERIKVYCGAEYGLSIDSTPEIGTEVTIRLPVIK